VKQKTKRSYIPAVMGEYASEEDMRSWAQELFLNAIWLVAPAPLYSLRDEILPRYRAAFDFEKSRGSSNDEVKQLAIQAFIDVVIQDELEGLNSRPEYQAVRDSYPASYEAAEQLLAWSKRYNLRGRRVPIDGTADPRALRLARIDSVWPLVAALETLFQWHFGRAGVVETPAGLPLWRPKPFKIPTKPETLPPIQLRTICSDSRVGISSELLNKWDPNGPPLKEPTEVDTPGWYVSLEPAPHFRDRVLNDFNRWLDGYIANRQESAEAAGLVRGLGKRELSHFLWAARYQVDKAVASDLAKQCGISTAAIVAGINWVLDVIRLEPRAGERGQKRNRHRLPK
jgi:hypothetical protein